MRYYFKSWQWRLLVGKTSYEGYVLAGYSESTDGDITGSHVGGDCSVIKCDKYGVLQWQQILGSSKNDYGFCIKQLINGGYILTGYS